MGSHHTHLQVVELMLGIDIDPLGAPVAVDESQPEVDRAQQLAFGHLGRVAGIAESSPLQDKVAL